MTEAQERKIVWTLNYLCYLVGGLLRAVMPKEEGRQLLADAQAFADNGHDMRTERGQPL